MRPEPHTAAGPVRHVRSRAALGLAAAALLAGCAAPGSAPETGAQAAAAAPADTQRLAPDVTVARLAPGLWVHTTTAEVRGFGSVPANGMLLETEDGSVLVDSGWNDEQAEALLAWAARDLRRPVRRAVVTHSHGDRTGGIGALRRAGIPVGGLALTAELARAGGRPAPDALPGLEGGRPVEDVGGIRVLHPGAGHTPDNVVVYFPRQRVLFGGCLVKADTATTVGNVADADVPGWPATVGRVREAFPDVRLVVPGHGRTSGPEALRHTQALIAEKGPAAVELLRRPGGR